ncbi:hypothetical protein CERSUDRAFT_87723 [Gelatoporia subvermispora B]|uniref:DUF6534 domain-containing protein n=1 Tax=Ceriporiopsis subvermispora (strain B) TaxID=914234 RepID=M2R365_CERS8|nr:hypothetical protein CERSUDRAFT_87723 [Gelatoporia subvermispora B]
MGVMLIGILVSAALWGIICAQVYHYYTHYNDTRPLRIIVLVSFLLDTAHQILISHGLYTYLITWYNDPLNLLRIVWSLKVQVLVTAFNVIVVEGFFIWRVWLLGHQSVLRVLPLVLLSLASFSTEILYYSKIKDHALITYVHEIINYAYILGAVGVAAIVAITIPTIQLLHSSKSTFTATNNVIHRLVVFMVATGVGTSVCAILSLVTVITSPNVLVFAVFYILLSRLATSSLLNTLNMRDGIRAALPNTVLSGSLHFASAIGEQVTNSRLTAIRNSASVAPGVSVPCDTTDQYTTMSTESPSLGATEKGSMV